MTSLASEEAWCALGFRVQWVPIRDSLPDGHCLARIARIERGRAWCWAPGAEYEVDLTVYAQAYALAVGDWLVLAPEGSGMVVVKRLQRFSCIKRRAAGERADEQLIAANVDTLFIVSSCNADFSLDRLERYLALALEAGVRPVLVLSKADLAGNPDAFRHAAMTLSPDLEVHVVNLHAAGQLDQLAGWCVSGQTIAMIGSSGVGKSTLSNLLTGAEGKQAQITQSARAADDKGRHTTTARSMHRLSGGGLIIDTPGMRELQLTACADGLDTLFADVVKHLGHCRFADCAHDGEPGCEIQKAIDEGRLQARRWASYRKLSREQAENQAKIAARQASGQKITRRESRYRKRTKGNKGRQS